RGDLRSILPQLPVVLRGGALFWPAAAQEQLRALSLGPDVSRVTSAAEGYALFFDDLLSRAHARDWFSDVLPRLARLLLRLPALLEGHYAGARAATGLRLLGSQDAGFVLLGQELAAALLACALFCLFPTAGRGEARLPAINFDALFSALTNNARQSQEHKVRCIAHYFERVTASTPAGFVSFE
uniref:PARG helical domain-containing protein n=1 Tax=Aegilops tauschii subsp. strangulata TaxID=200361 RepID=A0A453MGV6_AEGTS